MFHDKDTHKVYTLEGLDSESLQLNHLLRSNGITDQNTDNSKHAQALLNKCLEIQRDTCERISLSVGRKKNDR